MKILSNILNIKYFFAIIAVAGSLLPIHFGIVPAAPAFAEPAPETMLDLVFVIDNSGSMRKNDPNFITPKVVEAFVSQLPELSKVGIVLFDENARLLSPMTLISGSQAEQELIADIKKIDYRGQLTNTPVGIERGIYELKTNGRPLAQKAIVFITDGIVDTGDPKKDEELSHWLKEDLTAQCKQLGIRIFGIAFSEAADYSLIQALALRTNGEYFRTYEASEISSVLEQIQSHMAPEPKPAITPLPLLSVPSEKAKASPGKIVETDKSAEQMPPVKDKGAVVTEKSLWLISLSVVLLIVVLIGAVVFFYYQNFKRKTTAVQAAETKLEIPAAYLNDLQQVCGPGQSRKQLDTPRIKIGRSQRNDIIIDHPAVSGFHATIEFRNMAFYLEDQRSTNGTKLNRQNMAPNEPVRLKSGDRITFAKFDFQFIMTDQIPFGETVMLSKTALADPEAEATVVLDLDDSDSKQGLIACLQNHLMQIYGLGPKHKAFVNTYFAQEAMDIIATTAHKNLSLTKEDAEQHCTPIIKNKAFYVVCSLPAAIDKAADWYGVHHKGFTQFIYNWIRAEQYQSAQTEQLCIITFGQDPATWVSITIVPTNSEPEPVEIMSVDFLNDEEKASLALDFDNHGRVL